MAETLDAQWTHIFSGNMRRSCKAIRSSPLIANTADCGLANTGALHAASSENCWVQNNQHANQLQHAYSINVAALMFVPFMFSTSFFINHPIHPLK